MHSHILLWREDLMNIVNIVLVTKANKQNKPSWDTESQLYGLFILTELWLCRVTPPTTFFFFGGEGEGKGARHFQGTRFSNSHQLWPLVQQNDHFFFSSSSFFLSFFLSWYPSCFGGNVGWQDYFMGSTPPPCLLLALPLTHWHTDQL